MKRLIIVLALTAAGCSSSTPVVDVSPSVDESWKPVLTDQMNAFYDALAVYGKRVDTHDAKEMKQDFTYFCIPNFDGPGYIFFEEDGEMVVRDECDGPYSDLAATFQVKWYTARLNALDSVQDSFNALIPLLLTLSDDQLREAFDPYILDVRVDELNTVIPAFVTQLREEQAARLDCYLLAGEDARSRCVKKAVSKDRSDEFFEVWDDADFLTDLFRDEFLLGELSENTIWN